MSSSFRGRRTDLSNMTSSPPWKPGRFFFLVLLNIPAAYDVKCVEQQWRWFPDQYSICSWLGIMTWTNGEYICHKFLSFLSMTWQTTWSDCQQWRGQQGRHILFKTTRWNLSLKVFSGKASLFCLMMTSPTMWCELEWNDFNTLTRPPAVWIGVMRRVQTTLILGGFRWINHQQLHVKHLKDQLPTTIKQAI